MKHDHAFDIHETVARAFPGKDRAHADHFLRWLDFNGYTIVEKEGSHGEVALAPRPMVDNPDPQDKLRDPHQK
jgi:hypothetical protein